MYKLSDVPRTSDAALNNYLLQLYLIFQIASGAKGKLQQVVTRQDLVTWGLITEEQALV